MYSPNSIVVRLFLPLVWCVVYKFVPLDRHHEANDALCGLTAMRYHQRPTFGQVSAAVNRWSQGPLMVMGKI